MITEKNLISLIVLCAIANLIIGQGVGINQTNASPHPSAVLDLQSSNQGFLPPRMTTEQRNSITAPATGLMIYNTDTKCINYYQGSLWLELCGTNKFLNCGDPVTFLYNGVNVTYGTVVGGDNRCWMDRNLGAEQVATSTDDSNAYGDLFQWGRRDDGHQIRTSPTISILSNTDQPQHGNFIQAPNYPFDWRSPQNNNLWQGVNGINNPCPTGWRLPTINELVTLALSWPENSANGAFSSPLKLTTSGYRYLGILVLAEEGIYLSSDIDGAEMSILVFTNDSGYSSVSFPRGVGGTVRCIKN